MLLPVPTEILRVIRCVAAVAVRNSASEMRVFWIENICTMPRTVHPGGHASIFIGIAERDIFADSQPDGVAVVGHTLA